MVLLDPAVLVVDVQGWDHPLGDHARPEPTGGAPRDAPVEDELDLVGSSEVEMLADHLLEEDPPAQRSVQHLGQRKLGLEDRELVAVAGPLIVGGERVRQPGEPLAQQRVDLLGPQCVADRLRPSRVRAAQQPVVERLEVDALLRRVDA